jgi:hypothetical protein
MKSSLLHHPFNFPNFRATREIIRSLATNMIYTDSQKNVFTVSKVDSTAPPSHKGDVRFEVEVTLGAEGQQIFVGLLETSALAIRDNSPGIGISLDPCTGAITDVVNDQGIIGYLEDEELHPGRQLTVEIEVEVLNEVCIPRITISGEQFLHPALLMGHPSKLTALVGSAVLGTSRALFGRSQLQVNQRSEGLPA